MTLHLTFCVTLGLLYLQLLEELLGLLLILEFSLLLLHNCIQLRIGERWLFENWSVKLLNNRWSISFDLAEGSLTLVLIRLGPVILRF